MIKRGFTIVELLVVIMVMSIIFVIVGRVFSEMFKIRDTIEAKTVIEIGAVAATEWIRRDIASADSFTPWRDNLYPDTDEIHDLELLDTVGSDNEWTRSVEFSALTAKEVFGLSEGFQGTDETGVVDPAACVLTMRVTSDDYAAGPASSVYVRYFVYDPNYATGNVFSGNLYREVLRVKPDVHSATLVKDGERVRFWDPKIDVANGKPDATLIEPFIVARNIMTFNIRTMMIDESDEGIRSLTLAYNNNPSAGGPDYGTADHRYLLMKDPYLTYPYIPRAMVQALKIALILDVNAGKGSRRLRTYEIFVALPRALLAALDEGTK